MEICEKKFFDFSNKNWQTCFLVNKFIDDTSKRNVLFNLPNSMCFSFGLKEMISICEVSEEINNRSYFLLSNSFYDFLKKDTIFKKIDDFSYYNLLRQLKYINENKDKINLSLTKNYMEKTYKIYYKKYLKSLQDELEKIIDGQDISHDKLNFLANSFINELLSMGYTYKYLNYIFNYFYYENSTSCKFCNLNDLIKFLFNKSLDSFDMYLPIKNISNRDILFVKNQFSEQEIIKGDDFKDNKYGFNLDNDTYYCHIYFNSNDYFRCMEEQLNRVNSIFNILKFYTNSQISIDFEAKPFIYSKFFGEINRSSIKSMLQYSYFQGTTGIIETVNETFDNLNKKNNSILIDIYDIMNYSQKNHDIFSNDQFLSKWISLESCASKSSSRKGFDSVLEYVIKALSITFYRQRLTRVLKNSSIKCQLESFVENYDKESFLKKVNNIKNNYYQFVIREYINILSSNIAISESIKEYQNQLSYMLYRIYFMRNKYVHSGNTINNNDMLRYYLNIIEPFFLDRILKTLNDLVLNSIVDYDKVSWSDIFSEVDFKYELLNNVLLFMKEPFKISKSSSVKFSDIIDEKSRKCLLINLLIEHSKNLKIIAKKNLRFDNEDVEEVIIGD